MRKRERLERAIAGEPLDRVPVALWRHWQGDDQRYADLARATIDFQRDYNWDFVRVMPARSFLTSDYGLQEAWTGGADGRGEIQKRVIGRSLDWTELRPLSPDRGALAQQTQCMRLICQALAADAVPILQTIYSPLAQASQLAGRRKTLRDLRARPDRLRTGLSQLTETVRRFIERLGKIKGIAGIFLVTEFASYDVMSEGEYRASVLPHVRAILDDLPARFWLNIVQIGGSAPMLKLFANLPVQALNWDFGAKPDQLEAAKSQVRFALCGGLSDQDLLHGTPALIRSGVRELINRSEARRFILAGGGHGNITMPISNIRAVRGAVEAAG